MTIHTFNRGTCKKVAQAVEDALTGVEEQFGIKIERASGRFTANKYTLKLECLVVASGGEVFDEAAEDFKMYAPRFGLRADQLGTRVSKFRSKFALYADCHVALSDSSQ